MTLANRAGSSGGMGGQTSEVGDRTTRVLLESAMFDPAGVRRSSRPHALHTEASHRFERGMDERTAEMAANRIDVAMQTRG